MTRPIPFGHPKQRGEEDLIFPFDTPEKRLRYYDGRRVRPLLAPPATKSPLGLSFVQFGDHYRYGAVAWAGFWLKREFTYD